MAGSLVVIPSEDLENSAIAIRYQWEIHFSRFFNYRHLPSSCPHLTLRTVGRNGVKGTWISSSSTASLQLLSDHSTSEVILAVHFRGKILEEHFISKLNFSWPQVSCISGFPHRGSRVVFASYRDCVGQIQKFALRFSTIYETETFINALKEILKDARDIALPSNDIGSEISSQSEFIPSHIVPYRPREELNHMSPVHSCSTQMPISLDHEAEQCSHSQETTLNHKFEGIFAALPPSFTSLLTNCYSESEVKQAAAQPTASEEVDLKSQIARYMEDSSFRDILSKVERVIGELGDDFIL